jgi:hypothetical protein
MDESMGQRVADELDILRLLAAVAQSADDRDEGAYRNCFADVVLCHNRATLEEGEWRYVSSRDYARRSITSVSDMDWTRHRIGSNTTVILDGDRATARADVVVEKQSSDEAGNAERLTIGGRYRLEFSRFPLGWRMTRRRLLRRYAIGDVEMIERARQRRRSCRAPDPGG